MMKKFVVIAMALVCGFQLAAQDSETSKSKEYWISAPLPQNFNPFSMTFDYKVHLKKNTWLSFSALNLAFQYSENSPVASYNFKTSSLYYSGGVGFGLEFRKTLTPKLTLFHGPQLHYTYSNEVFTTYDPSYAADQRKILTSRHAGGINYPIGLMYSINDHLFVAAQLTPGAALHYTDYENRINPAFGSKSTSGSFGFTDNVGSISVVLKR